jgi:hypothetical protein
MDSIKYDHETENENIILDFLSYNSDKNIQNKIDSLYPVYSADYMHEDVFDNVSICDNIGIDDSTMHGEFNNMKNDNNTNISNTNKSLIQPFSEKEHFIHPHSSSTIACKIWKDAGLFDYVTKEIIDEYLYKYVVYNNMYYYDNKGKMHVTFYSESGTKYTYTWESFVLWMMCCIRKVEKKNLIIRYSSLFPRNNQSFKE